MTSERSILEIRKRSLMSTLLSSVVLSLLYVASLVLSPHTAMSSVESPIFEGIALWQISHPTLCYIFIALAVIYISLNLARIASRFSIYGKTTHLPMELYPIFLTLSGGGSLRDIIVSLLLLWAIQRLFSSYRSSNSAGSLSHAAISLGVIPLLYPPLIGLWMLTPFIMFIFERTLREVIVFTATLIMPLCTYLYVTWLMGGSFSGAWCGFTTSLGCSSGFLDIKSIDAATIITLVITLYLLIISILSTPQLENTVKARRRVTVVTLFYAALALIFFIPASEGSLLVYLALPLSLLAPITLLRSGRMVSFALYLLLILLAIVETLNLKTLLLVIPL